MLKQIYEAINRHHFETVFNIPVLIQGIRSDIPVLISQSEIGIHWILYFNRIYSVLIGQFWSRRTNLVQMYTLIYWSESNS